MIKLNIFLSRIIYICLVFALVFSVVSFSAYAEDDYIVIPDDVTVDSAGTQFASGNIRENVDIISGRLSLDQTDAVIPGLGALGISLNRIYNNNLWSVWRQPEERFHWGYNLRGGNPCPSPDSNPWGWESESFRDWETEMQESIEQRGLETSEEVKKYWQDYWNDIYNREQDARGTGEQYFAHGTPDYDELCIDGPGGRDASEGGGNLYLEYLSRAVVNDNDILRISGGGLSRQEFQIWASCYNNRGNLNDYIENMHIDILNSNLLGYGFGVGWSFSMGKISSNIIYTDERYQNIEGFYAPNKPRVVFPDGSSEDIIFNDELNKWITESFAKVEIVDDYTVKIRSTTGITYTFDWYASSLAPDYERFPGNGVIQEDAFNLQRYLYLTKAEDDFGNYITVNYYRLEDYNTPYIKSIETSTGKSIDITLTLPNNMEGPWNNDDYVGPKPTDRFTTIALDTIPLAYYTSATYKDFKGDDITVKYEYDFNKVKDTGNRACHETTCHEGANYYYPGSCYYGFLNSVSYYKDDELLAPQTNYEYNTDVVGGQRDQVIPFDLKKIVYPSGLEVSYEYYPYTDYDPFNGKTVFDRRIGTKTVNNMGNEEVWTYGPQGNGNEWSPPSNNDITLNNPEYEDINLFRKAFVIKPDGTREVLNYFASCRADCLSEMFYGFPLDGYNFLRAFGGKVFLRESYDNSARGNEKLTSLSYNSYTPKIIGKQPVFSAWGNLNQVPNDWQKELDYIPVFRVLPQSSTASVYGDNGEDSFGDVKWYAGQSREDQDNKNDDETPSYSNFNLRANELEEVSEESSGDYDKYLNGRYSRNYGEVENVLLGFSNIYNTAQQNGILSDFQDTYFFSNWLDFENINSEDDLITKSYYLNNDNSVNDDNIISLAEEKNNIHLIDHVNLYDVRNNNQLNIISSAESYYDTKQLDNENILVPYKSVHKGLGEDSDIDVSTITFNDKGLVETKKTNNDATYDFYKYDDEGRIVAAYNCLGIGPDAECNQRTGKLVSIYSYYYNNLLKSVKDAEGNINRYLYDSLGRPIKIANDDTWSLLGWGSTEPNIVATYDDENRMLKVDTKQSDNTYLNSVYSFYDMKGQQLQTRQNSPEGNYIISKSYDIMGRPDKSSKVYIENDDEYRYNEPDWNSLAIQQSVARTEYDIIGRVKKIINFDNSIIKTIYGTDWTKLFNENDVAIKSETDAFGNLVKITEDADTENPEQRTSNYDYDSLNRLTHIHDAEGRTSSTVYDSHSRPKSSTHPDTGESSITHYNNGLVESTTNAKGITIKTYYDDYNRIDHVGYPDGTPLIKYAYDDCYQWKLCSIIYDLDSLSGSRSFYYDNLGRIEREHVSIIENEGGKEEDIFVDILYKYDVSGNVISEEIVPLDNNQISYITEYDYDELNRLYLVRFKNAGEEWQDIASFTYTSQGSIDSITYANGVETGYDYNSKEFLKSMETYLGENNIFSRSYEYDPVGNLHYLKTGPNEDSQLLAEYKYDNINRLTDVLDNNYYGAGYSYIYDDTGNRLTKTVNKNGEDNIISYNYNDNNNQLMNLCVGNQCNDDNIAFEMSYDAVGNLLSKTDVNSHSTKDYTYNYANMISSVDLNQDNSPENNYYYDSSMLRVKKSEPGATTYYFRDLAGNVVYELCRGKMCSAKGPDISDFDWSRNNFIIQDKNGMNILAVDQNGEMLIKGSIINEIPENDNIRDFVIDSGNGMIKALLDGSTGNLYLAGQLNQHTEESPSENSMDFRIQSSNGADVVWFDNSGNLFLKGRLVQNVKDIANPFEETGNNNLGNNDNQKNNPNLNRLEDG